MRHFLSGLAGGLVFCGMFLWLDLGLVLAGIGAVFGWGGAWLALRPPTVVRVEFQPLEEEIQTALATGGSKVARIRELAGRIHEEPVRIEAMAVADIGRGILEDMKKDGADLAEARQFLDQYLSATVKVLERYVDLCGRNLQSKEAQTALGQVGQLLVEVRRGFQARRAGLATDGLIDLDVEMQLLRSTVRSEGGF